MPDDNKAIKDEAPVDEAARKLLMLGAPVSSVKGIGSAMASRLEPLRLRTVGDLVYHFPRRYLDRSNVTPIREAKIGEEVTVVGRVTGVDSKRTRTGKNMLTVTIFDNTGYVAGVWFNQAYHADRLEPGSLASFSGKLGFSYRLLQMVNPAYDVLEGPGGKALEAIHTGRVIPVYRGTAGVTSALLRRLESRALEQLDGMADPLPESVRRKFELPPLFGSLKETHFPTSGAALKKARFRALFDEIFTMQVGLALIREKRRKEARGVKHGEPGALISAFVGSLPFELTGDQMKAWAEILSDMRDSLPMNRLLQGEVGSGKTVVAVMAMLLAVEGGRQAALMAPTEVLASQHYRRISEMLDGVDVGVALRTSSMKEGSFDPATPGIVIGTHALIQESAEFGDLGVVIIDEQHRFGLDQREALAKKGTHPDVLHMSATPIPRSLSMTLYGDLDVSEIREMPAGREPVITVVAGEDQRQGTFAMVENELSKGRQVFVICPLIEGSKKLEAKAAAEEAKALESVLPGRRLELLHGQMKAQEKKRVMEAFADGEVDVLVATVVVEVGIDVPNASVMIIENADRFGLAQLHQLRGRVGRGSERAYCVMFADPTTDEAVERMRAIRECADGFALAEEDLRIRGEGSLFGTRQSGLPDLRMVRLTRDLELIRRARAEAFELVKSDPGLRRKEHRLLLRETARRFPGTLGWLFKG